MGSATPCRLTFATGTQARASAVSHSSPATLPNVDGEPSPRGDRLGPDGGVGGRRAGQRPPLLPRLAAGARGPRRASRAARPVEVVRDIHGVPHAAARRAATRGGPGLLPRAGPAVAAGARAPLRARAAGGAARPARLGTDRLVRILGLAREADREAGRLLGDDRAFVDAYCAGVNAYLRSPRYTPPFELRLLKASTIEPWALGDALLAPKALALLLGRDWEAESCRRRLRGALPPERYAELAPAIGAAPARLQRLGRRRDAHGVRAAAGRQRHRLRAGPPVPVVRLRPRLAGRPRGRVLPAGDAGRPDRALEDARLGPRRRRGRHAGPVHGRPGRGAAHHAAGVDPRARTAPPARRGGAHHATGADRLPAAGGRDRRAGPGVDRAHTRRDGGRPARDAAGDGR